MDNINLGDNKRTTVNHRWLKIISILVDIFVIKVIFNIGIGLFNFNDSFSIFITEPERFNIIDR